jgi:hypothetical protein
VHPLKHGRLLLVFLRVLQGMQAMVTGIVACAFYLSLEKAYGFSLVFTDWYYQQNTFMRMLVMQVSRYFAY